MKLGVSGHLTKAFIRSPLTPLLLLAAIVVGVLALVMVPREEEPQISVPMVDIMVQANGLKAVDAAEMVTKPLEDIVKGIDGVDHVYSQTVDDGVTVTARFNVGTDEDVAMLRVHETIRANMSRIPLGIPEPLIVGRGINDVPIVVLTLSPEADVADRWTDAGLHAVAEELLVELIKVEDVGLTFIVGGRTDQIRVEPDPERLSMYGLTLNRLVEKLENANRSIRLGRLREAGDSVPVVAGQTLQGVADIGDLLLTTRDGRPVYVKDVADVIVGTEPVDHRVWQVEPATDPAADQDTIRATPAVSVALAKRKGANAVVVADSILERLADMRGRVVPDGIEVAVTRNYGETALEKSNELLSHLGMATITIVALITLAIGWRAGMVVAVVIPTTILLTLFSAWMMGYTINRVSLFALIFSIGILVDDAIVIVENMARHWAMKDGRSIMRKAIEGVAEVGNPTIIATLTIIAALLPMMFVSGLMGPYMSPIPANASAAMVFSFFVAVMLTPWLLVKIAGRGTARRMGVPYAAPGDPGEPEADPGEGPGGDGTPRDPTEGEAEGRLGRLYRRVAAPVLKTRARAWMFLIGVGIATIVACVPFYTQHVTVKLLPFDNKSELQVVLTLPQDAPLEQTERTLMDAARRLADLPELVSMQLHAGTAAPFNFNGLVRHSYLRNDPYMGDLQLNLTAKHHRERASHAIALEVRERLADMDLPEGTALSVVEVPPGPPVLATLLAEIYGPDAETRRAVAEEIKGIFRDVDFIVDVDDSWGDPAERLRFALDQQALEYHGVEEEAVFDTLSALLGGVSVGYSHRGHGVDPVEIAVRLPKARLSPGEYLLSTPVPGADGIVELGDVVRVTREPASHTLFRRDGHFAEMVQAELAGRFEAPIYGMLEVQDRIDAHDWDGLGLPKPAISLYGQPETSATPTVLWDGEWEITYVTFRDMGAAFGVAILGIYLLVVAQFGSFKAPLVILTPVPLTLIGIVFGHWLFSAPFTATSMIGFIALAGIIVRNSILLVDFIKHRQPTASSLREALLDAGAIRFTPILLTAVSAIIGAAFILTDPIFQGLALSLCFGLASSTALTLLVIPAIYVALRDDGKPA
ncbi:efflux RND transporter permease subunit [Roseospira navarrensis]|uniref:AcrB/AcrD/AcrF family protein n=1 Tax=Roseospira navarrensis TaxID=140058 RepID=A0A7X1ZCB4_9PROT|nr:efflux RND transporter permease subunit [Roseospira navarrensis]MQX34921.1 AcrB/AcrD/AcrF family protein [Roseospira navarrensis]